LGGLASAADAVRIEKVVAVKKVRDSEIRRDIGLAI